MQTLDAISGHVDFTLEQFGGMWIYDDSSSLCHMMHSHAYAQRGDEQTYMHT